MARVTIRLRAPAALLALAALAAVADSPSPAASGPAAPVSTRKQLFVDTRWIESSENVTLTMNPPYQTGERLVVADQPWERGGHIHCYNSILRDDGPDGARIRLWYDIVLDKPAGYPGDRRAVGYHQSDDMLRWDSFAVAIGVDPADAAAPLDWVDGSGRVISEREAARIADCPGATSTGDTAYFATSMDVYRTGVFKYAEAKDVHVALVPAFYHGRMAGADPWPDTFDTQLAVSRDGHPRGAHDDE